MKKFLPSLKTISSRLKRNHSKDLVPKSPIEIWSRKGSFVNLGTKNSRHKVLRIATHKKNGIVQGCVAVAPNWGKNVDSFSVLYYPKKEHIEKFGKAAQTSMRFGPGSKFPGAVGSSLVIIREENNKVIFDIDYLQAHFRTPQTPNEKKNPVFISRSLATKYEGWRMRVLDTIFKMAKKQGVIVRFTNIGSVGRSEIVDDLFNKLAKENGFVVVKSAYVSDKRITQFDAILKN